MFDLGFMEMLVIGVVALIVVGPKDLPGMFRALGRFMGKAKGMAREFSNAMNAAADEAGVNEINKTLKAAANPQKFGVDKIREATKFDTSSFTAKSDGEKPDETAAKAASGASKAEKSETAQSETDKLRAKMTDERAATAKKLNEAMAKAAEDRVAAEKAAKATENTAPAASDDTPAAKDAQ